MLIITENTIKKALKFYNIENNFYLNKCLECIEFINSNNKFKQRVEIIWNKLYFDEIKTRDYWKIKTLD